MDPGRNIMAKVICKKCGKIFSDVSAFCPKCGAPAEISSKPESIGGRQMAAAGRSARTSGTGSIDGKKFNSGDLLSEGSARGRNLSHSHRSFDDICSDDSARTTSSGRGSGSGAGSGTGAPGSIPGSIYSEQRSKSSRSSSQVPPGKIIAIIIAVIVGLNILMSLITSCASMINFDSTPDVGFNDTAESYYVTADGDAFIQTVSDQIEYRSSSISGDMLSGMTDEEYVNFFKDLINGELSELEQYQDADVADLEYYRDEYIMGLNDQLMAIENFADYRSEYDYFWNTGYRERVYVIMDLYDLYGMQVDNYDAYRADLDAMNEEEYDPSEAAPMQAEPFFRPQSGSEAVTLPLEGGGMAVYDGGTDIL